MDKAIIVITGTPSGKGQFEKIAKQNVWLWNVNPKNWLGEVARRHLYWSGEERNEEYHRKIARLYSLVNEEFGFEGHYIAQLLERFRDFDKEVMRGTGEDGQEREFTKFLLVIHGISKELTKRLEEEEGALQVHVTSRTLNTNVELHDYVLYEDDADFEERVLKLIKVLT